MKRTIGEVLLQIEGAARERATFTYNAVIQKPGDPGNRFYVIRSGVVVVRRPGQDRTPVVVDVMGPGDAFGELPTRDGISSTDSFVVRSRTVDVLMISTDVARTLLHTRPSFAVDLARAYDQHLRVLEARLGVGADAGVRLAEVLLDLADRIGTTVDGVLGIDNVSQSDIADLVGATRSFVCTLLNELKRKGVLNNDHKRRVGILDRAALERHALGQSRVAA